MVIPGTAPVTVFVALLMGIPSTVNDAFFPCAAWVNWGDVLVIVMLFALPELLLTIESREPLASFTTLAVTPRL